MNADNTTETSSPIAVFDIDGTFFRWQLYHNLIFSLKDKGFFSAETSQNLEQALFDWKALRASWADYENMVVRAGENELINIEAGKLVEVAHEVVANHGHRVYSYSLQLLNRLKEQGYYLLALSASQQEIVSIFAGKYGFDHSIGMLQKQQDGKLVKGYERSVHDRKAEILRQFLAENPGLTLENSLAIGDSGSDIDILEMVHNPIAFNPSQELLTTAIENSWKIVIERKNIAYELITTDCKTRLSNYEIY